MVIEQVDFIDLEDAAVGGGQKSRLNAFLTLADGVFQVHGAHHSVFGGADRTTGDPPLPAVGVEAIPAEIETITWGQLKMALVVFLLYFL